MPDWRTEVRRRLANLNLAPELEADIVEELGQHMADRFAELQFRLGEREAERIVRDELTGAVDRELRLSSAHRAHARETLGAPARGQWWNLLVFDTRYALRALRMSPAFSVVAIVTLALGIGGSTLIFSAVNAILLKPLPYPSPDRIVQFWGTSPEKGLPEVEMPLGIAALFHSETRTLEYVAGFEPGASFTLTGVGDAERIMGASMSLDYFRVLGVSPLLGRAPTAGEDLPTGPRVAVISYGLWQRRFGADSGVVGRSIAINGAPTTIVGVMPPGFDMPVGAEIWLPIDLDPTRFNCWCLSMVGRMKPGVSPDDVRRDLIRITDGLSQRRPDIVSGGGRFVVVSLAERLVGGVRRPLLVLLGAIGCVLLIVCANIANLLLARTTNRSRELAVRCCLGASSGRIAAQLLTESALLSLTGATLGSLLALWGIQALRQLPVAIYPRVDAVRLDGTVLAFTIAVAALTAIACGIASAIRATRVDLQDAIKDGARGSATRGARRLSDAFVVVQFALSLVLLASAGLLLRSYLSLVRIDAGYRTHDVVVARVAVPYPRYDSAFVVRDFYRRLLERVRRLPGVQAAGLVSRVPLSAGNPQDNVVAEGQEPIPGKPVRVANVRFADEDYFDAIGTPLVRGRRFTASDNDRSTRVAVVDEAFARHFWGNADPIGKRFRHQGDTASDRWLTIIGVVRNVKHMKLDEDPDLQEYEAFSQRTTWTNFVVVRTSSPDDVGARIRREVRALDPLIPVYDVRTMKSAVDRTLSRRRLTNSLLLGFSLSALLLATIGVYGVISIGVAARVREFGIRVALGAKLTDVSLLVLRRGFILGVTGIAAGMIGAYWSARALGGMLYGVGRFDWITFASASLILLAAAIVASYLPARRAARADPMLALRSE
jgi:putative ABC transport system permease protein